MKNQILSILIAVFVTATLNAQTPLLNVIKTKLETYNRILPYEKVYVQCDRSFYAPGDDIWMALWITDGFTHKASGISEIVTIEIINPKGTIEKTKRVLASHGRATCDFTLDSAAMGGMYKIKAYTNWMQNFGDENKFVKEIQVQSVTLPNLRMKLDMQRKAYGTGDTVRANFLLQTLENLPLPNFDFKYTVNLNGEEFLQSPAETDKAGKAIITFILPPTLQTNDGVLIANINYKGNIESISRSIPIIMNQIDLQFFPEGGDLVTGTMNNCAFKALNEYGKPADLEGAIFNNKHQLVAHFKSYHQGMGAFRFAPKTGEKYYALIDRPEGILQLYPLPQPVDNGYLMEIPEPNQFINPNNKQEATVRIFSPENSTVSLVVQVLGKIVFSSIYEVKTGENALPIPLKDFPGGIAQFTLFTKNNTAICERLVFVKKDQQLKLQITSNKASYLPREKVKLNIKTSDASGKPVAAQLSLAIVDDKLIAMSDDKSDNILSYLLLSSELKGKIEEPNFYFNPQETKADSAIDYLLLTQGWRRFTWENIVKTTAADLVKNTAYNAEKKILCGTITSEDRAEILKTRLYIMETGQKAKPDKNGYYEFAGLDLTTPLTLVAISGNNDTILTTIRDYTSAQTSKYSKYSYDYDYNYVSGNKDNFRIQGIVKDKDTGAPLPGATILIKGTLQGTITDIDGKFYLAANKKGIISISYIGYQTSEVKAAHGQNYTIELEKDFLKLNEIRIIGYGTVRKTNITGSYSVQHTRNPVSINTKQDNATRRVEKKPLQPAIEKKEIPRRKHAEGTTIQLPVSNDEIIMSPMYDIQIVEIEEEPAFCAIEERPIFPGGNEEAAINWIQKHLTYPVKAQQYNISGKIWVKFMVNKKGIVTDPVIVRGIDPTCDEEVLRVLRMMPTWRPGKQNGRPVNTYFMLPVSFNMVGGSFYGSDDSDDWNRKELTPLYYRARQFYSPVYSQKQEVEVRTDFRKTIYWNPLLTTDSTGTAHAEFYTSDDLTTFRTTTEGINAKGEIGRNEYTFYTQKPVSIDAKIPEYVNFEDTISIPVIIKNTTSGTLSGKLHIEYPSFIVPTASLEKNITIPANDVLATYLDFAVLCKPEYDCMKLTFETDSFTDVISSSITAKPYGFPNKISFSGINLNNHFDINIPSIITNSLRAQLVAYPSLESSLTSAIQAMLREPYGCFEQASATTYPNIMVLQYLKEFKQNNKQLEEKALEYITKGYKLLEKYETSTDGFEWFGQSPAHEGLTAFGLMEFNDMKTVCSVVDNDMYNRTLYWLLNRRDNRGGFNVEKGKYGFSNNAYILNNAYLIYALSEVGNKNLSTEFNRAFADNVKRNDAYCMALLTNAALNLLYLSKANDLLDKLKQQITKYGLAGLKSETSITGSSGKSLNVETISLLTLALLKHPQADKALLNSCIRYILDARTFGTFGSTQANILALKALTQYRKSNSESFNSGKIAVTINGKSSGSASYSKDQSVSLLIDSLAKNFTKGSNLVNVDFEETVIPADFNLNIEYTSRIPSKENYSPIRIETMYKQKSVHRGETVRITTTIRNTEKITQSMTVASIVLPAGFSFQPWQLKELQEKSIFDYYEIRNNELYLYYRTLEPNATHTINLDLNANIPGIYHSALSSCYIYYAPERRSYSSPVTLEIKK